MWVTMAPSAHASPVQRNKVEKSKHGRFSVFLFALAARPRASYSGHACRNFEFFFFGLLVIDKGTGFGRDV